MRRWILKLLIASLLFAGVESMASAVDDLSFHQTHHAHVSDAGNQWFPDIEGDDHGDDACEHFCHAYGVALTRHAVPENLSQYKVFVPASPAHALTHSITPPTPPPNL